MTRSSLKIAVKFIGAGLPIIGTIVQWTHDGTPPDVILILGKLLECILIYLSIDFAIKMSPAEALATGYFHSFVKPVALQIKDNWTLLQSGVRKEYAGGKLEIRLPQTLIDPDDPKGFVQSLKKKEESATKAQIIRPGGIKDFDVHVVSGGEPLVIVDVPNALGALRLIVSGTPLASRTKKERKELAEFKAVLRELIKNHGFPKVLVTTEEIGNAH